FKTINDSYGHSAGDKVLQEVAQRMSSAVRSSDTVARLGGDEFAIVMEGRGLSKAIPELIQTLSTLISAPIQFEGHTLQVGASIGSARFPTDGSTMKKLMAKADQAMYAKKRKN